MSNPEHPHQEDERKERAVSFLRRFKGPDKSFYLESSDDKEEQSDDKKRGVKLYWKELGFVLEVNFYGEKKLIFLGTRNREQAERAFDEARRQYIDGEVYNYDYLRPLIQKMIDSEGFYSFTDEDEELMDLIGTDSLSADELDNPWDLLVKKGVITEAEVAKNQDRE